MIMHLRCAWKQGCGRIIVDASGIGAKAATVAKQITVIGSPRLAVADCALPLAFADGTRAQRAQPQDKGSSRNEISLPLMSTPSAASGDRLDAARVELFHRRLDGGMHAARAHAAEKTEMEKLNALPF